MECSNCADNDLSRVTAVQSSAKNFGLGTAKVDHRLDGKEHAFFKPRAGSFASVVQNVGWGVETRGPSP